MAKINHKDMVNKVSEKLDISGKDAQECIDCYINTLMEEVINGNSVGIKYLGVVKITEAAERKAWDFKEKRNVTKPSRSLPKFVFHRSFINNVKDANKK